MDARRLRRIVCRLAHLVMRLFAERFYEPFCGNGQRTETQSTPLVEGWSSFSNRFAVTAGNCNNRLKGKFVTAVSGLEGREVHSLEITNHFVVFNHNRKVTTAIFNLAAFDAGSRAFRIRHASPSTSSPQPAAQPASASRATQTDRAHNRLLMAGQDVSR
jgi:hypothetical protein